MFNFRFDCLVLLISSIILVARTPVFYKKNQFTTVYTAKHNFACVVWCRCNVYLVLIVECSFFLCVYFEYFWILWFLSLFYRRELPEINHDDDACDTCLSALLAELLLWEGLFYNVNLTHWLVYNVKWLKSNNLFDICLKNHLCSA
jgi:hypothetical protein